VEARAEPSDLSALLNVVSKVSHAEHKSSTQRLQSVVRAQPYTQADKQASPSAVCRNSAEDKQKDKPEGQPADFTFPAISSALRTLLRRDMLHIKP
jgi:hypothetical protein